MRFIDDIKNAPKFWSVRLLALSVALQTSLELIPLWSAFLPDRVETFLVAALTTAAVLARVVKQNLPNAPTAS